MGLVRSGGGAWEVARTEPVSKEEELLPGERPSVSGEV